MGRHRLSQVAGFRRVRDAEVTESGVLFRRNAKGLRNEGVKTGCQKAKAVRLPVYGFQKIISGKYKLRILWDLQKGPRRYGEIRQGLLRGNAGSKDMAPRVLSRELKALAALGMIERRDYQVVPPKVEYRLTSEGRSLRPVISVMHKWGV
jgi:DNA-binding HxlR family transcriptional regulator